MKRKEPCEETGKVKEEEKEEPTEEQQTGSENKKQKLNNDDNNKEDTTESVSPKIKEENGNQQQKEELSEEKKEILKEKIKKQIEFYFSDSNLPNDKFLKAECAKKYRRIYPNSINCYFQSSKKIYLLIWI